RRSPVGVKTSHRMQRSVRIVVQGIVRTNVRRPGRYVAPSILRATTTSSSSDARATSHELLRVVLDAAALTPPLGVAAGKCGADPAKRTYRLASISYGDR